MIRKNALVVAPVAALALVCAFAARGDAAEPLPPLDHAAVLAAVEDATSGGLPAFLIGGIDESGTWAAAAGTSDLKTGAPADPNAAFRIGSISKMFVAVAILKLVDQGKVGLDTPVSTYLPGLLKRGKVITIRMLLQHRAGLATSQYGRGSDWSAYAHICHKTYDPVAVVKAADLQLFEPGTDFYYSNAGYTALGLVIEKVTGQPYEKVLHDRIAAPLGLDHTSFQEGAPVWPGPFLHGYADLHPGKPSTKPDRLTDETDCKTSVFAAAGSGISTTHDLATFMHALTHGVLLPQYLYSQMIDGQDTNGFFPPTVTYGLGIMREVAPCGVTLIGHGGTVLGYNSIIYSTLDGVRTTVDAEPVLNVTDAMYGPMLNVYIDEFCGGASR